MYNFCTYFDKNYLTRGITLYQSLASNLKEFTLFVACLDDLTYETLKGLNAPNIIAIPLIDIENKYPELLKAKSNRKLVEYYFTLTPFIPSYIFESCPRLDMITYLDADLLFYSTPEPIFNALGKNSILITPHRFPSHLKHLEKNGLFNVQFIIYRNDTVGRACLNQYMKQCLEWCYDYPEENRYADQKYLDFWPEEFKKVSILENKGGGLAPWNWMQYKITIDKNQNVFVDGDKLIFFHFHSFKMIYPFLASNGLGYYGRSMPSHLIKYFYQNYISCLKKAAKIINPTSRLNKYSHYSDIRSQASILRQILSGLYHRNLMIVRTQ